MPPIVLGMQKLVKTEGIRHDWNSAVKSTSDRMETALKKEQDLQEIEINRDFEWPQSWNSPPFLLWTGLNFEEDAEIINDVLEELRYAAADMSNE